MKYLLFLLLPLSWSCTKQTPTNDYQNTPIGLDHLYDNTTGGSSGPFGYSNPGGKIPNPNAIGISAFGKPLMFQQDIKKLNGKGSFAGGYSIRYSSPDPKTGYSNLSVGEGTGVTLDSTSTSGSIKFVGYTGVTYPESGISNRYFSDTSTVEKPVVVIVHDSITSHLEFYPAQVTYVKRFYVRGYYYNYSSSLEYQPVDTSLLSSRVILVDGLVKPSNLFIIE